MRTRPPLRAVQSARDRGEDGQVMILTDRTEERRHRTLGARTRRVSRSTFSHLVRRFEAGTLIDPASAIKSALRAMTARWPSTLKINSSPSSTASASRTDRGIVTRPFEVTRRGDFHLDLLTRRISKNSEAADGTGWEAASGGPSVALPSFGTARLVTRRPVPGVT